MALSVGCNRVPLSRRTFNAPVIKTVSVAVKPVLAPAHRQQNRLVHAAGNPVVRRANSRGQVVLQANLFSRIVRVVKSYISGFVGSFEDPERLLDRVMDEMKEDLVKLRQAAAQVRASEIQAEAKYKQAQQTADDWLRRADLAVRKNQDDLAREALLRRKTYQTNADTIKKQLDQQRAASSQLQANMKLMESKLTEAASKKDTLKARAASAQASKQIQEMISGLRLNNSSAWSAFDKMEEKVVAMEAEVESVTYLSAPDQLEQRFLSLENKGVDDELAELKRGMRTPTALPAAREYNSVFASEVDYELEQLRKRARQ